MDFSQLKIKRTIRMICQGIINGMFGCCYQIGWISIWLEKKTISTHLKFTHDNRQFKPGELVLV